MSESHRHPRDRKIVDTGWGIKPDDQPANADEAGANSTTSYRYDPAEADIVRKILQAQRRSFNTANRVRVETGRTFIYDINKDAFVVEGLGFGSQHLIELLDRLGAAFNPDELRQIKADASTSREYSLSRAWAWGAERPA
jgi:hypothetical protein